MESTQPAEASLAPIARHRGRTLYITLLTVRREFGITRGTLKK